MNGNFWFVLIFLFGFLTTNASTLFIGNGGEGFRINGSLYVRDLVEANVHLKPVFDCPHSDAFRKKINLKNIEHLNLDLSLLNRKLCDIESLYVGFSEVFISAINFHSWTLITESLGLLPDDGPLLDVPSVQRVQLANRTLYNIRIQTQLWKELSPEHKIALVFHEIVFSLLKFDCTNSSCTQFQQSARVAREVTGLIFSNSHSERLLPIMQMAFNATPNSLALTESAFMIRTSFSTSGQQALLRLTKPDSQSLQKYAQTVCLKFAEYSKPQTDLEMHLLVINRTRFYLEKVSYLTLYGLEYGFTIKKSISTNSVPVKGIRDSDSCFENLTQSLDKLCGNKN